MPVGHRLTDYNSKNPRTIFRQKGNPFGEFKYRKTHEGVVGKDKPKPTRKPVSQLDSKKPTDPFGRLTMTALDGMDGIFNYLFYNNTNIKEEKTSEDTKTINKCDKPIYQSKISSTKNTNNQSEASNETPSFSPENPSLASFLSSIFCCSLGRK